jgi:Ca2+/Na+ antiporter
MIRLVGLAFVVLTVIYICLSFYSRAVRRGKLEAEWLEGGQDVDRDTFVQEGLTRYDSSLRRKLILGVYVVPTLLVMLLIYLTNFA